MLTVSRFIIGIGAGVILPAIPLYQAEVSPAHARGLMVGLHVYIQGREAEAEATMIKLHRVKDDPTDSFARQEFMVTKAQLDLDMQNRTTVWNAFHIPSLRKRLIIGFLAMMGTQCSGLNVLLSYSPVIYGGLGFSPFMTNVMAGLWTTMNGIGNLAVGGYIGVVIGLVGATVLTKIYAGTETAGNKAAVFFIFWIIVVYTMGIEPASFIFASEIFPSELRAQGVAFSMQGLFLSSTLWSSVASPALSNIGWKFYIVFIATSVAMIAVVYFLFPETKGYTLEQLGEVFGDEVVDDDGHLRSNEKRTGFDINESTVEATEVV
ncbi:hypothetical protein G7Z17_g637 [Cylindrodendrum hubeiense]|uniref:Major facilitator superfamily (MFS) profile domain-containing protein n=1 Tax=Cylindrodendrum hubeiense TaxID=595255 RepID=A0A9P5HG76_9HYPO|nr:hypothetical protein G7Z17_g637 [Cylindrodendrum hubeiense]